MLFKKIALAIALTVSPFVLAQPVYAGPGYVVIVNAANAQKVKKAEVKKAAKPAPKKKEDGKIKPLEEGRKVPTLKKKYKKD